MKPVAVLGAGLAGLTAASDLKRRGVPVIVFEAGPAIGGMATSFRDAEGFSYDYGAHFISNRLADALGGKTPCRTVRHYGEAVRLGGTFRKHPFGLLREPRFLRDAIVAKLTPKPIMTAEDWFRATYGDALAEEVAIPLAEAWSGSPASELSAAIGEKFDAGILKSLYLTAAAKVTGRAVCNGYTREMPEGAGVYHVYPEGGLSQLLKPMTEDLAASIRLETPVERIIVENDRVVAVRARGETIAVSAAISTAPVNVLPRLLDGTDRLSHLAAFRYRPMIFVNLRFSGRAILPDTMLWVPGREHVFFRLTEAPISMPWLAPEGKTLITCDIGCELGNAYWTMPETELAALCLKGLAEIFPGIEDRSLGAGGVIRTPYSYPVYLAAYEAERLAFARTTGVDGLYSVGRNGEFAHILMEDVYWRTLRRMNDVADYLGLAPPPAPRSKALYNWISLADRSKARITAAAPSDRLIGAAS